MTEPLIEKQEQLLYLKILIFSVDSIVFLLLVSRITETYRQLLPIIETVYL